MRTIIEVFGASRSKSRLRDQMLGAQFGKQRTQKALLEDDLAILFTADLGPAISAIEMFGASTRLSGQHRRRVSAFLQDIAGKGKQRLSDAAPFVKRVDEKCADRPVARVCC